MAINANKSATQRQGRTAPVKSVLDELFGTVKITLGNASASAMAEYLPLDHDGDVLVVQYEDSFDPSLECEVTFSTSCDNLVLARHFHKLALLFGYPNYVQELATECFERGPGWLSPTVGKPRPIRKWTQRLAINSSL